MILLQIKHFVIQLNSKVLLVSFFFTYSHNFLYLFIQYSYSLFLGVLSGGEWLKNSRNSLNAYIFSQCVGKCLCVYPKISSQLCCFVFATLEFVIEYKWFSLTNWFMCVDFNLKPISVNRRFILSLYLCGVRFYAYGNGRWRCFRAFHSTLIRVTGRARMMFVGRTGWRTDIFGCVRFMFHHSIQFPWSP